MPRFPQTPLGTHFMGFERWNRRIPPWVRGGSAPGQLIITPGYSSPDRINVTLTLKPGYTPPHFQTGPVG